MEALVWRRRRESSPAARKGRAQRAGLTPDAASKTLHASGGRFTSDVRPIKITLTLITVSTASGMISSLR